MPCRDNTALEATPVANVCAMPMQGQLDDVAIAVRGIGKRYHLYGRPQERLKQQLLWRFGKQYGREFWALRDVSFDVHRGEVFGIIGCNGSGKSTLLQILAGILRPTTGTVQVQGRVTALLELGSGFDPEFTGRENVLMNGAILGIPRARMAERLEQIAIFADIGHFINQPVKTYSSGMFLRLAFAVAINVEVDILLIDEVLAVGDVFFRQKCYRHLEVLRERGVTIVLVSHAMADVEQFCQRVLILHRGCGYFQGTARESVRWYYMLEQDHGFPGASLPSSVPQPVPMLTTREAAAFWPVPEALLDMAGMAQVSNGWARCTGIAVCNAQGQPCGVFQQGEMASFFYEFELLRDIEVPVGGLSLQSDKGVEVHGKNTLQYDCDIPVQVAQGTHLRFQQDVILDLALGDYTFMIGLATLSQSDFAHRSHYAYTDLYPKIRRLCYLPAAGCFTVTPRHQGVPVQILHHGIANLPGQCRLTVVASSPHQT